MNPHSQFYYWQLHKEGPKIGVLIFEQGELQFNLNDADSTKAAKDRLQESIGEVWLVPAYQDHNAIGAANVKTGLASYRGIFVHKMATIDDAIVAFRKRFNEIREEDERCQNDPVLYLEREMKAHDWWYCMADDHQAWETGSRHRALIDDLVKKCPEEKVRELWSAIAPKKMACPV